MKSLSLLLSIAACALAQTAPAPAGAANCAPPATNGLYAVFNTSMGCIVAELYEKETPVTVANFVGLAEGKKAWKDPKTKAFVHRPMYNNITFHRIMMDQMIQAGDPTGKGDHDCGVHLKDEIRPDLKFDHPGRLAMANLGEKNTGGCQFFITQAQNAAPWDGQYTIFGQVVQGQDVVKAISRVPVTSGDRTKPKDAPKLISVVIKRVGPEPPKPAATPARKSAPVKK